MTRRAGWAIGFGLWGFACTVDAPPPSMPTYVVTAAPLKREVSAEGNLRAVRSTQIRAPTVQDFYRGLRLIWVAPDGARIKKGDVIMRFDPTTLTRELADHESDRTVASAHLQSTRIEARASRKRRTAEAHRARRDLEMTLRFRAQDPQIYSRHARIEAEVDERVSRARLDHAKVSKRIDRGVMSSKIEEAEVGQQQAHARVSQVQAGLAALEIRAPHDGLLVLARNAQREPLRVGDEVSRGRVLAVIPDLTEMEAQVFVLEADGQGLRTGLPVTVTIESMPDRAYEGRVVRIDDVPKQRIRQQPVQYFAAVVALERTDDAFMKPGQRLRARIRMGSDAGVIVPRHAIFAVDGETRVYVWERGRWSSRVVEMGAATVGRVIITRGLRPGEVIALTEPRP